MANDETRRYDGTLTVSVEPDAAGETPGSPNDAQIFLPLRKVALCATHFPKRRSSHEKKADHPYEGC
jgi:hypothetical protein